MEDERGGSREIRVSSAELVFGMLLNSKTLGQGEKYYLELLYRASPNFKKDLEAVASVHPAELDVSLNALRFKHQEKIKQEVDAYLDNTSDFSQSEKDYLKNNYSHKFFWENLCKLTALEKYNRHSLQRHLFLNAVKIFIRKYKRENPETTAIAALDVEAWQSFQARLFEASKRLSEAMDGHQALVWMGTEALFIEIRKAADKLPKSEVLGFINRLRRDDSFKEIRKGLHLLSKFIYTGK